MRRQRPEDGLQEACAQYCDLQGWAWYHVPNEGKRGKAEAARLQRQGVKPGIPDVIICEDWADYGGMEPRFVLPHEVPHGHGVAIELKAKPSTPTPNQRDWLARLKARGWYTAVCYSIDEFIDAVSCVRRRR